MKCASYIPQDGPCFRSLCGFPVEKGLKALTECHGSRTADLEGIPSFAVKRPLQPLAKQNDRPNQSLWIARVEGRSAFRQFIRLPWSLYGDDPMWVPPLLIERRRHLSSRNPYFAHAQYCSWLAYRGLRPVGRISAQVDELHIERYRDATGFFGMIEAEDNAETFQALTDTAEQWLRGKGMRRILGPLNLSLNQEGGLLVEGFDTPPSIMMSHARRYYGPRIEEQGYRKEKDLLAYLVNADFEWPPLLQKITARAAQDVRLRPLRMSRFAEELKILQGIFEDAWSQNWGFVPFTRAEFQHMGQDIKFLVDKEFVQIAEVNGAAAGMIVVLPNLNEAIRDLNGRLFPFGWMKLLWRLKVKCPTSARVPLMGVCRRYQETLLGPALAIMLIDAARIPAVRRGIRNVEMSWILEDNMRMRTIIESIGGTVYKRYRIYGKELA
ncbi:MAG TPA: N-acetyltransferase [Thermodesulfobacteriota bacterium]|nr:N-acetyltransferase [Thermodesulfobacteriota bacterium]